MMQAALNAAHRHLGQASPNPPVGAAAFDIQGRLLAAAAHIQAGTDHAEAAAINICRQNNTFDQIHTIAVTLSPCTHFGRTPPCTEAILATPCKQVLIGLDDPNAAASGGAALLRSKGLDVATGILVEDCLHHLGAFAHRIRTGKPFVTVKFALNAANTPFPLPGHKTFTSPRALQLAHMMRKKADAIITGADTVLADSPAFNVRYVADYPGKARPVYVCDRRKRTPDSAFIRCGDFADALARATEAGAVEVLVEAGPTLTGHVLEADWWDLLVVVKCEKDGTEQVFTRWKADEALENERFDLYRWLPYEEGHAAFTPHADRQLADRLWAVCRAGAHDRRS